VPFLTKTVITSLNIIEQFFFLVGCEYLPCCGNASFEIPAQILYIEVQIKLPNTDKFKFTRTIITNKKF
jgi:hypothetical protein